MSLQVAVSIPFRQRGVDRMGEGEFVVALSMDRDWFTPDQAQRLADVARGRGLLSEADGDLVAGFEPAAVEVPDEFHPDESILLEQSTFERALDALVAAGVEKQTAVAEINELQRTLEITIEAAAVLYARRRGVDVDAIADDARRELLESDG